MLIISLKINVIRQFQYKKALFNHYGQQYMVASAPLVRTLSAPAAIEETEASHSTEPAISDKATVYDLFGRAVMQNVTRAEAAGRLSHGIYLHNGSKIIVR